MKAVYLFSSFPDKFVSFEKGSHQDRYKVRTSDSATSSQAKGTWSTNVPLRKCVGEH